MFGFGSSTLYRMAVNPDGSPNWVGIGILMSTLLAVFVWRCVVIISQSEGAVRQRFGKVARDKNFESVEIDGFEQFTNAREYDNGIRMRIYAIHSLAKVNRADRKTELENKTVTYLDRDYTISPSIIWAVSRDRGCMSKALFNVQDADPKDKKNAELEQLVRDLMDDAIVRVYAQLEETVDLSIFTLPALSVEEHLSEVSKTLYIRYGVQLKQLMYGQRAVSPAQREKEGNLAIAAANEKIADAIGQAVQSRVSD